MKMETTTKETLVDRYLAAVSDLLPARQRKDTVTEISSLIQDALEDRSTMEGKPVDDQMMETVLKEFGSPEKIVAPYLPQKYLIGPRLYPSFILVLRIALPIVAILVMVAYWMGAIQVSAMNTAEFFTDLIKSLGGALSATVQAFANIVLIFAILEWTVPEFKVPTKEKEWNPHNLKEISKPNQVKRGDLIAEVIFTFIALIIFNFYYDRIGIYNNTNGVWTFIPIMTDAFKAYIPWLDMLWILTIVLDLLVLRKGVWQTGTRVLAILVSGLNIAILVNLIQSVPMLFTLEGALGYWGSMGILKSLINQFLIIAMVIGIIASVVKIIQMLLGIAKSKIGPPYSIKL
jgi:uncharacterized membrane protein YuzA (DUF378 family)